jgi:hypothetical protein
LLTPMRHAWLSTALVLSALGVAASPFAAADPMTTIAERYVKLVLAVGQHDADYVDAYYGPPEWKPAADAPVVPLADLRGDAAGILAALAAAPRPPAGDELATLRHEYLVRQVGAIDARLRMLQGERLSFDEESKALYDAVAPTHPASAFEETLAELGRRIPGDGPLHARYDAFRKAFIIPSDRLDAVFTAAIEECRARTTRHLRLPAGERFRIEYVTGKSWSGYNWYQGGATSLIQLNTDLPIYIDRAVDLACHEGYPGHHVYNVLLEQHLVRDRQWLEFTVYALFSPQSLIAEGTANFGIEVAFPGEERTRFERERLYPLAGLDRSRAAEYADIASLVERLSYAGNEAARGYLDGRLSREEAIAWLETYAMNSRARAEQRVRFFDQYRSYVINYNLGKDLVRAHIEARGGTAERPERRWEEFGRLLASPRLPSSLAR